MCFLKNLSWFLVFVTMSSHLVVIVILVWLLANHKWQDSLKSIGSIQILSQGLYHWKFYTLSTCPQANPLKKHQIISYQILSFWAVFVLVGTSDAILRTSYTSRKFLQTFDKTLLADSSIFIGTFYEIVGTSDPHRKFLQTSYRGSSAAVLIFVGTSYLLVGTSYRLCIYIYTRWMAPQTLTFLTAVPHSSLHFCEAIWGSDRGISRPRGALDSPSFGDSGSPFRIWFQILPPWVKVQK